MAQTTFDEAKAYELYYQHQTDTEIAKEVGALTMTIRSWRKRKGLPNISPNARKKAHEYVCQKDAGLNGGIDYRDALEPEKSEEMKRFLRALSWGFRKAKEAGVEPRVELFIKAWREKVSA